ncbi:enoyl-CoA hydratase/isomerase family protein [Nocardioides ungokensis]|uniref:enoyl-CoA hydratase/isomerase family protein n=1 Tax=Nocardioides ungokensis TaxID=1643322 RepID=UPI0024844424|nr:enoyl-CoA hydratase/isomerase family protein [Nocardioides ungokensis]
MADLEVRAEEGVLWLTLNRPHVFNALSASMADELASLVEDATARDDVRVVVLTGTGPAFSTGADISGADAHEHFDVSALDRANRIIRAITRLDKPVVAAVNGVAAGWAARPRWPPTSWWRPSRRASCWRSPGSA